MYLRWTSAANWTKEADKIFGRRRRIRSSGDSTWPPQSHRTGGSSSQTAPPPAPSSVNWDDDLDDFMPPKPWPPRPDVPPPVHESRTIKERKGKSRGSSSQTAPPPAPSSVNWDDDLDDFMPPRTMASKK